MVSPKQVRHLYLADRHYGNEAPYESEVTERNAVVAAKKNDESRQSLNPALTRKGFFAALFSKAFRS